MANEHFRNNELPLPDAGGLIPSRSQRRTRFHRAPVRSAYFQDSFAVLMSDPGVIWISSTRMPWGSVTLISVDFVFGDTRGS